MAQRLQLVDHLLMICNHLLRELFDFRIFRFLQRDLAQLDFRLVLAQQACGQEMVDRIVAAGSRLCRAIICSVLVDLADSSTAAAGAVEGSACWVVARSVCPDALRQSVFIDRGVLLRYRVAEQQTRQPSRHYTKSQSQRCGHSITPSIKSRVRSRGRHNATPTRQNSSKSNAADREIKRLKDATNRRNVAFTMLRRYVRCLVRRRRRSD